MMSASMLSNTMTSSVLLTLVLMSLTSSDGFPSKLEDAAPTPPTFPESFFVSFLEVKDHAGETVSANYGSWFYDFKNTRARFDHKDGQTNFFCGNQSLSPLDPKGACQLFFTPTEDLIVNYPNVQNCCRLCGKEEGCTIIKPTWLQDGANLTSVERINGAECYGWTKEGAVSAADTWYSTADGFPCRYHEMLMGNIVHNLTFMDYSYKPGPQDPSMFDFPAKCKESCPHPYKPRQ